MHTCPECGQACYCNGDHDDAELGTNDDAERNCICNLVCCDDEHESAPPGGEGSSD